MPAIEHPVRTLMYKDVSDTATEPRFTLLQSTVHASLFSDNAGRSWYDSNRKPKRWQRWLLGWDRYYVTFPYNPQ